MSDAAVPGADLIDQLLGAADAQDREWLLETRQDELTRHLFDEFKARVDKLMLEQPAQALSIAEIAVQAACFSATPLAQAMALWMQGNALTHLGRYRQAMASYRPACALYQQNRDQLSVGRLQSNMVSMLKNLGRYEEALLLADEARASLQPWAQSRYMAALEMNLGSLYRLTGHYQDALDAYLRGRAILIAQGDSVQAAQMDINRARVWVCLDRFREAEELLQAARQILAENGKLLPAARADLNLGTLFSRQGRHREALRTYDRARAEFVRLQVETDAAVTDLYRSFDYLALNLLPEALRAATAARETLERQAMPRYVALAAGNQGVARRKMHQRRNALDDLRSARAFFVEQHVQVEAALLDLEQAICLHKMQDWEQSISVAQNALQVLLACPLPLQVARARLILADGLLETGKVDEAASVYAAALASLPEMPSLAWWAHDGLGRVAEARGPGESGFFCEAYAQYRQAISCMEQAEDLLGADEFRAGFLDDKLAVYQRAARLALALGDLDGAFDHVERSRSGVWRDALSRSAGQGETGSRLAALRQDWHWLYSQLTRPQDDQESGYDGQTQEKHWYRLRALKQEMAQERQPVRRPGGAVRPGRWAFDVQDVQRRIPPGALLLDYFDDEQSVFVFAIDAENVRILERLVSLQEMERSIPIWQPPAAMPRRQTRGGFCACMDRFADRTQQNLASLYQMLIAPLGLDAAAYSSLWIVPYGRLWEVPFAALYDGQRYLAERFELTCLPGLAMRPDSKPPKKGRLLQAPLIAGCPGPQKLEHVLDEARAVAAMLNQSELLLEEAVTAERVRTAALSCTLLHMAAHGRFRGDAPLFSALDLADGELIAGDLETWDMSGVELVTLSACQSGRFLSRGSDLLGLPRGFFCAGARQLVVSLWAVDDVSTADLMTNLYDRLRQGKSVAAALQSAQMATMARYPHPFYWAGFEVMALL